MSMRQEINLYLPELRPQRDYLSARFCGMGLLLMVVLVTALVGLQWFSLESVEDRLKITEQRVEKLRQSVEAVKSRLPKSQGASLDTQITSLREELDGRKAVRELIQGRSIGNTGGFSVYMDGLARAADSSLYLSMFQLTEGGRRVSMAGKSRSADAVPRYVGALRAQDGFSGSQFGPLMITREENSTLMAFRMTNGGLADDE